jgi:hypothetical protein
MTDKVRLGDRRHDSDSPLDHELCILIFRVHVENRRRWVIGVEYVLRVHVHPTHRDSANAAHEYHAVLALENRPVACGDDEGLEGRSRKMDVQDLAVQRPDRYREVDPLFRFSYPCAHGEHNHVAMDLSSGVLHANYSVAVA